MLLLINNFRFPGTDEPIECPVGTFRPSVLGQHLSDCQDCTGGMFCNTTGLIQPAGKCQAGYYCPVGSHYSSQRICPEGYYCPEQSEYPTECQNGTASNQTGLTSSAECAKCPKGFYCATTKLTEPTGLCTAGYYCPTGSSSDKAIQCPSAMHCPLGSAEPKFCPDGNYTSWPKAEACSICPAGFYCIANNVVAGEDLFIRLEFLFSSLVGNCHFSLVISWSPVIGAPNSSTVSLHIIRGY